MPATFHTADPHFWHRLMVELRGFSSMEEHNGTLITRWNKAVKPEDTVYLHGDTGMGSSSKFLPLVAELNGTKHLISGNHDEVWAGRRNAHKHQAKWLEVFASVQPFARRRIGGRTVLLSHFPYRGDHTPEDRFAQFRLRDEGDWLLHGHTHQPEQVTGRRQIHVGLDAWDLTPVSEVAILKLMEEIEARQDRG
jgi:calcineurin-like phosphoesterase family protein